MRNRLRFALSLCVVLAAAGAWADQAEDTIEATVKKLGGSVVRGEQLPGKPIISVALSLSDCKDADLKVLTGLKSLTSLALYRTGITNAGLKEVASLKTLTSLDVMKTKITDSGLKELARLDLLERLALASTELYGSGLKEPGRAQITDRSQPARKPR